MVSGLYSAFTAKSELSTEIIVNELTQTRPLSVTRREDIDRLRAWAADRAVPAN